MLLSQLKYFQVVAQYQHISRAAEELHVAQPALSATIAKLEKKLGVPLFDRQGRNIELNYAGKHLLEHVDFIFEQLTVMEESLEKTKEFLENEFTLSVSNSMFLNGWLQQFVLANPKIRLRQKMLSENQMLEALLDESVDVALGEFETVPPGITRKTVIEDEYVIIIPQSHPLAAKETIYFEDIQHEDIIALPSNTIFKIADRIFAQRDCKPNIVFEGNQRMMNKVIQLGKGLLFASRQMLYAPYSFRKQFPSELPADLVPVVVQAIADLDCQCKFSLCWKKDRELPVMAQKFIDAMEYDYPKYKDDEEYLKDKTMMMSIVT